MAWLKRDVGRGSRKNPAPAWHQRPLFVEEMMLRRAVAPASTSLSALFSRSLRGGSHTLLASSGARSCVRPFSAGGSFDVFQKLKDPPQEGAEGSGKRKPSDRVLRLVDEIMSLTLIEAADLCDLCQEKLAPGDGSPIPGRMPFPHPLGMFPGMGGMGGGMGMPMMQQAMPAAQAAAPVAAAPAAEEEVAEVKVVKKEVKKEIFTLKLVSYETAKKINVVKEVRAVTQLGLKEAKELVESAPKVVKKGIPAADVEAIAQKLRDAGAEVLLE